MSVAFSRMLRDQLITLEGVRKHGPVRRASTVFSGDSVADSVYFLESGFVKLVCRGKNNKEVLISIIAPGQIFGEQALTQTSTRDVNAEMMQDGTLYEIPRSVFLEFGRNHPDVWLLLVESMTERQRALEMKVSLLCLEDVENRILHYLRTLAPVFGVTVSENEEYAIPLSQSELACLIGTTRETTSTTLNALARRGLLRLGRRQLIVPSAAALSRASLERAQSKSA